MTAGRKRPTSRAKQVTGENDDAARPAQHAAPIGRDKPRVVRRLEPGEEPPARRPRGLGPLHPETIRANIAAGWAAKARRDGEARERHEEE